VCLLLLWWWASDEVGRSIGVSNFKLELLQRIVKIGKTLPTVNQVRFTAIAWIVVRTGTRLQIELHPYNYASWKQVLDFSAKHGIVTEAYGSLACVLYSSRQYCTKLQKKSPITKYPGGPLDPVLATIAQRIGGTPGQVIFKWAHAKRFVVVTTTERRTRLDEYLGVFHLRAFPPTPPHRYG
jgi:diketogulonate reductase-like aldo/keto reductase